MKRVGVACVLAACSADGGEEESPAFVDTDLARSCVEQFSRLTASMAALDVMDVEAAGTAMARSSQRIVLPASELMTIGSVSFTCFPPLLEGSGTCDASTCSLDHSCNAHALIAGMSGTIQRIEEQTTIDLHTSLANKFENHSFQITSSFILSDGILSGTLHTTGEASTYTRTYQASWDVFVTLDEIAVDAAGCPIAGSLGVVTRYDTDDHRWPEWARSFERNATVVFGPGCGDASSE